MLEQAKKELQSYPKCQLIQATAEDTTLEDTSIDLITIGQAFHRFNNTAFKNEAKRILKKEKYIAIFYNN
jgi:ubiquinone/menaquinone biosynthesis C-methylase UbiE